MALQTGVVVAVIIVVIVGAITSVVVITVFVRRRKKTSELQCDLRVVDRQFQLVQHEKTCMSFVELSGEHQEPNDIMVISDGSHTQAPSALFHSPIKTPTKVRVWQV